MKHFTKQNTLLRSLLAIEGLKSTILFTHQKRKLNFFLENRKSSATKHSPPSYHNFLIKYSLICIVKLKFTRRNEI